MNTAAVSRPADGVTAVASTVTSTGPTTNTTSSSTDSSENAVGSSGVPLSACAQRARTSEPGCG